MNTRISAVALLATVGAVALAGSPVAAKTHRPAPVIAGAPAENHNSFVAPAGQAQHVYAPSLPALPYTVHGLTPDFQLSHL